ncbi:MAG: kynureninase [Hyphomicrobiaceae bacterium]
MTVSTITAPATPVTRSHCLALDRDDPLASKRAEFELPDGIIYLDGNSLGCLPKGVAERVGAAVREQWGADLITSWNKHDWFTLPGRIGDRIGTLIGAPAGTVVTADTISVNLFKLVAAALRLRPGRRIILSDTGNFPTDLYIAEGVLGMTGQHELKLVAPEAVASAIDESVALVMLTEVDYATGRRHDMRDITRRAHEAGALVLWDLAHSAGAIPVDLEAAGADLAVGCTYKYLNGGPGAPAFLYVRRDLQEALASPLSGWWGHAEPFAFTTRYRPAAGITRQQCGTQPMLSMIALDAALDAYDRVDMGALYAKAQRLAGIFIGEIEWRCGGFGLTLAGPRDLDRRGSQVSFHCPEGYAVMQALIAHGVVGDFRAPDKIRFGLTPLYTRFVDVFDAAVILEKVMAGRLWERPEFRLRSAVT